MEITKEDREDLSTLIANIKNVQVASKEHNSKEKYEKLKEDRKTKG